MTVEQAGIDDAARLRALSARLDELSALEDDWDSYGALSPTARAIAAASRLMIEAVAVSGAPPDAVMPVPDGGLQAIWERGQDELQIDVGPTGAFGYLAIHRGEGAPVMREAACASLADVLLMVGQLPR